MPGPNTVRHSWASCLTTHENLKGKKERTQQHYLVAV